MATRKSRTKRKQRENTPTRRGRLDPVKTIKIHGVYEDDGLWMHTHGLADHGLPELEIRGLPRFFFVEGGSLLNALADYLLNEPRPVKPFDYISLDGPRGGTLIQLVPAEVREPITGHYDHPRLTVQDPPPELCCDCDICGFGDSVAKA
jgi:hypothetical protein